MKLADIIGRDQVILKLRAANKGHLLEELSRQVSVRLPIQSRTVLSVLSARERLGSTGLGQGFALPHSRIDNITQVFGLFARLARPVEFEAIDRQPVDLVFLLLIPYASSDGHLAALAAVSRKMRDPGVLQQLRRAESVDRLHDLLTSQAD
jgi:PTS system nitrogen regulatory IIA component